MSGEGFIWTIKLDWLNILTLLGFDSIKQIPQYKKEKAIKRVDKLYSSEVLIDMQPIELDKLVANELRELMKKEIAIKVKEQEKMQKEIRNVIPFKNGGVIKINPQDLKDLGFNGDPEEFIKKILKRFSGDDEDEKDDEPDKYREDSTGYYI